MARGCTKLANAAGPRGVLKTPTRHPVAVRRWGLHGRMWTLTNHSGARVGGGRGSTVGLWKTHTSQRSRRVGGYGGSAVDGGRVTHVPLLQRLLPLLPPLPPPPQLPPPLQPLPGGGTKRGLDGGTRTPSRTRTAARTPDDLRTNMTTRTP